MLRGRRWVRVRVLAWPRAGTPGRVSVRRPGLPAATGLGGGSLLAPRSRGTRPGALAGELNRVSAEPGPPSQGLTPRASARCCRLLLRVRPWTLAPRREDGASACPAPSTLTGRPVTVTGSSWDPCPAPRLASRGPAGVQARFPRRPAVRDAFPVGTRSPLRTPVPGRLTAWPSRRLPALRPTARQPCSPLPAPMLPFRHPHARTTLGPTWDRVPVPGVPYRVRVALRPVGRGVRGLPRTRAVQLGLRETWLPFRGALLRARTIRCPARGTGRWDGARGRVAGRTGWAWTARSLAWAGIPRALLRGRMAGGTACTSVRRVPLPARSVRSPTRTLLLRVPTCAWTAQRRGRGPVSWGRPGTATAPRP